MKKEKSTKKPRERKPNWKEVYASVEDIQRFLDERIMMRFNVVTRRTEVHRLSEYNDEITAEVQWEDLSDRLVNTLWAEMSESKQVVKKHMEHVIESEYVGDYHPFRSYLDRLPKWDGESDYILALSVTVQVKGGTEEQELFYRCLKKWLVGMVAGWVGEEEVNHSILVLLGRQGIYKTTWFTYLLPPELRKYFYTKTNGSQMTKDDKIVLSQYGLVCCEELDSMQPREMNQLKSLVTTRYLDERAAYERYHEHRKHIASFCGTGNNVQFLSDATGTRRWLPFEVESIVSPRDLPFDYEGIYSQAYALYKQGYSYYFSEEETERLQKHNEHYETADKEADAVLDYFRIPVGDETGEFISTTYAQQIITAAPGMNISTIALGRAFARLGFQADMVNRRRGFYVVRITPEERRRIASQIAYEAKQARKKEEACTDDTDGTDVF